MKRILIFFLRHIRNPSGPTEPLVSPSFLELRFAHVGEIGRGIVGFEEGLSTPKSVPEIGESGPKFVFREALREQEDVFVG